MKNDYRKHIFYICIFPNFVTKFANYVLFLKILFYLYFKFYFHQFWLPRLYFSFPYFSSPYPSLPKSILLCLSTASPRNIVLPTPSVLYYSTFIPLQVTSRMLADNYYFLTNLFSKSNCVHLALKTLWTVFLLRSSFTHTVLAFGIYTLHTNVLVRALCAICAHFHTKETLNWIINHFPLSQFQLAWSLLRAISRV